MSVGGPEKRRRQSEEGQSNVVRDEERKAYIRPIKRVVQGYYRDAELADFIFRETWI